MIALRKPKNAPHARTFSSFNQNRFASAHRNLLPHIATRYRTSQVMLCGPPQAKWIHHLATWNQGPHDLCILTLRSILSLINILSLRSVLSLRSIFGCRSKLSRRSTRTSNLVLLVTFVIQLFCYSHTKVIRYASFESVLRNKIKYVTNLSYKLQFSHKTGQYQMSLQSSFRLRKIKIFQKFYPKPNNKAVCRVLFEQVFAVKNFCKSQ